MDSIHLMPSLWRCGQAWSPPASVHYGPSIDQTLCYWCFETQKIWFCCWIFFLVKSPRIHAYQIQKMEKYAHVPSLISSSVSIGCQALVHQINTPHVPVVQGHRKGPSDFDQGRIWLLPSGSSVLWKLSCTCWGYVNQWPVQPVCDCDVICSGSHRCRSSSFVFQFCFIKKFGPAPFKRLARQVPVPSMLYNFNCWRRGIEQKKLSKKNLVAIVV